ncbi:MAG: transposase [Erythrobacter sp.]|nr:MAG: transposase [Thermomicrobiales bacterium]GIX19160.1 MAG: transposase [Erythrobacter sp.]
MGQITVLSGPERRRRWSDEERLRILTEAFSPGACVSEVARRHDISTALIYTWRRKLREAHGEATSVDLPAAGFAEAVMVEDDAASRTGAAPAIVIDLVRGKRVSIFTAASPAQVAAALKALR